MGGKTRSEQETGAGVEQFITEEIKPHLGPVQQEFFPQLGEALRTGGIGANIPIMLRSIENSRVALGQSQAQTANELTRVGLGGTPFEQRTLAEGRRRGEQQIADIGPQFAQQLAGQAPGIIIPLMTAMLGAVSGAGRQRARGGPFST